MGRTRGKRAHAFQPELVPVGSSAEFAPQVSGSGECSSVLAVPGEEEVRIPGFPSVRCFPAATAGKV